MSRARKQAKPPAKRWLFHGILSDTPLSPEDSPLRAEEIQRILKSSALYPGLRVATLRLTELPERVKKLPPEAEKNTVKPPENV